MSRISDRVARLERAFAVATTPPPAFVRIEGEPVPPNLSRYHMVLPGTADPETWERECEVLRNRR